ncbi:MAG: Uma2 family endonuclease [Cyclobacteriaceae bacterium]
MSFFTLNVPDTISLTDDQLFELCSSNKESKIERDKHGNIIIMSPAGGQSSIINAAITAVFFNWNQQTKQGVVFDSSGGFILKDGSMRSADVSWVSNERWKGLSEDQKEKFPPLAPDFIIEIRSRTDQIQTLQDKMKHWMDNGVSLGWLVDPVDKKVWIYSRGKVESTIDSFKCKISASKVVTGFELDLENLL